MWGKGQRAVDKLKRYYSLTCPTSHCTNYDRVLVTVDYMFPPQLPVLCGMCKGELVAA